MRENTKRGPGQPKSKPKSIRILKRGDARLSPDLAKASDLFKVEFKGSKIILTRSTGSSFTTDITLVRAYASNNGAASTLISLRGTLVAMGYPPEVQKHLAGIYEAKIVDNEIQFDLDREVKK
jgi:hypothetical protein